MTSSHMTMLRAGQRFEKSLALLGHLGIIQSEKRLEVGHEVGVDALQRFEQRNSCQLRKWLFDL